MTTKSNSENGGGLKITARPDESVNIRHHKSGDIINIGVVEVRGKQVKLAFRDDPEKKFIVLRESLLTAGAPIQVHSPLSFSSLLSSLSGMNLFRRSTAKKTA